MPQVIEGEHAVEKHQDAVGNVEVIGGVLADVFQPPHDVIRAIADRTGGERRQAFHGCWTMLLQEFLDDCENISRAPFDFACVVAGLCPARTGQSPVTTVRAIVISGAAGLQAQKRAHAKKRIASNFFSTFDRLQQEGIGLSSATARNAETGVSRSAEIDFATGTSVASRAKRANSL